MTARLAPAEQVSLVESIPVPAFHRHVEQAGLPALATVEPTILQVNVGKLCNQRCRHCHVDAGPHQVEANMSWPTFAACLGAISRLRPAVVDITGGAPELNPHFRRFVREARALGVATIIDRCNLTVLLLESQRDIADFLAEQRVSIVASLPAANAAQTDAQRGEGVFARSIRALKLLNGLGYGREGSGLALTLMSNPVGAFLPPPQAAAEARFKSLLRERWGVEITSLIELTNMPINRFLEFLAGSGNLAPYLAKLSAAFNPGAVAGLMCRNTLSVGWDGTLYDCDFNQQLELPISGPARTIFDLDRARLTGRPIVTGKHCLGCTAGQGSSCGGATA